MAILLILLALAQDADEYAQRLGDDSAEVRDKAARELLSQGRKAVPTLRKIAEKPEGEAQRQARSLLKDISEREVTALLKEKGHEHAGEQVEVRDEGLTAVLPHGRVYILRTKGACGACGSFERTVIVNDLTDEKGKPALIRTGKDIVPLFPEAAKGEEGVRKTARAALFVLRATQPKAHTNDLIGKSNASNDPDNWWKSKDYKVTETKEGWTVTGLRIQFNHDFYEVTISFDKEGRLGKIEPKATGMS